MQSETRSPLGGISSHDLGEKKKTSVLVQRRIFLACCHADMFRTWINIKSQFKAWLCALKLLFSGCGTIALLSDFSHLLKDLLGSCLLCNPQLSLWTDVIELV